MFSEEALWMDRPTDGRTYGPTYLWTYGRTDPLKKGRQIILAANLSVRRINRQRMIRGIRF